MSDQSTREWAPCSTLSDIRETREQRLFNGAYPACTHTTTVVAGKGGDTEEGNDSRAESQACGKNQQLRTKRKNARRTVH